MINFEEIRASIVSKGLAHEDMANAATQKVIFINGEWNRDGSATITKTSAGWVIGDFSKTLPVSISVPETARFNNKPIMEGLQSQFPDAKIIVKIV